MVGAEVVSAGFRRLLFFQPGHRSPPWVLLGGQRASWNPAKLKTTHLDRSVSTGLRPFALSSSGMIITSGESEGSISGQRFVGHGNLVCRAEFVTVSKTARGREIRQGNQTDSGTIRRFFWVVYGPDQLVNAEIIIGIGALYGRCGISRDMVYGAEPAPDKDRHTTKPSDWPRHLNPPLKNFACHPRVTAHRGPLPKRHAEMVAGMHIRASSRNHGIHGKCTYLAEDPQLLVSAQPTFFFAGARKVLDERGGILQGGFV